MTSVWGPILIALIASVADTLGGITRYVPSSSSVSVCFTL